MVCWRFNQNQHLIFCCNMEWLEEKKRQFGKNRRRENDDARIFFNQSETQKRFRLKLQQDFLIQTPQEMMIYWTNLGLERELLRNLAAACLLSCLETTRKLIKKASSCTISLKLNKVKFPEFERINNSGN